MEQQVMRVLFFYRGQEYMSIEYLSSVLKKAGHETDLIFDYGFEDTFIYELPILKKIKRNDKWLTKIANFKPDLIAFSCLTNLYPFVKETAALIKKHFSVPIIVGGIHPTSIPEYVLADENIDMVCIGEGENALLELVNKMEKREDFINIKNLWIKVNGKIVKNPIRPLIADLDTIPFPDRSLFDKYGCLAGTIKAITGRGCPFQCTFCYSHSLFNLYKGEKFTRRRSVGNVIEELLECKKLYKVNDFYFFDDTFTINFSWLRDFSNVYKEKIATPFSCCVRPGTIHEEMVKVLKEAGLRMVFFGVDSGNDFIRKKIMGRNIEKSQIIEDAKLLKKYNIIIWSSVIFGSPGETIEQMRESFDLVREIGSDCISTFLMYPFPNTDIANYAIENNFLSRDDYENIKNGESSYHKDTYIKLNDKDKTLVMKFILPIYNRYPFLKPLVEILIKNGCVKLGNLLYLLGTLTCFSYYGRTRFREYYSMLKASLKLRVKRF